MKAADARRIMREAGVNAEEAKRFAADAPPLSEAQRESLRAIFTAPVLNATKAGTDEPAFALTDTTTEATRGDSRRG